MDKIRFKRILGMKGESLGVTIPQELIEFLELKNGDEITFTAENGKYGKFAAIFREKKKGRWAKISSFKVFAIDVANIQTRPIYCNKNDLQFNIDVLLNNKTILKVVVIKKWVWKRKRVGMRNKRIRKS